MNPFFYRRALVRLRNPTHKSVFNCSSIYDYNAPLTDPPIPPSLPHQFFHRFCLLRNQNILPKFMPFSSKSLHSLQVVPSTESEREVDELDGPTNEFLSRFVHVFRNKLTDAYPKCDKETIDAMLLLIVQKVVLEMEKGNLDQMFDSTASAESLDLSQDLWKTIWEVSHNVLEDMKKESKRRQTKQFLQSEDVKEMCRFASDVGIRGDMLRELRFKWAREKMEEDEFYQKIERLGQEVHEEEHAIETSDAAQGENTAPKEEPKVSTLPQRRGNIKYKIYGLDLSSPKWAEVADRIAEAEKNIAPEEPKEITGKCEMVTEKVHNLKPEEDPSNLLAEWSNLLQPRRVDWLALLSRLKDTERGVYLKVAEHILSEETFDANTYDFSKLIDDYAKENRVGDAERILEKMSEKGISPDVLTSNILVHMYSKTGDLQRAKNAFEHLRSQGFPADLRLYSSMIMAYVNADEPKSGELLMREMEGRGIKPNKEVYMGLLRAFSRRGLVDGAQKIFNAMHFAGFQPNLESCTLLVEAYGKAGDPDQARSSFDEMRIQVGQQPDDRCTASMIAAYERKNLLDKALNLLLDLEKDGFKPGFATYSVLVDWMGKLQLVDEAEQLLRKISEIGEEPSFNLHVSLCDMYSRSGNEEKALEELRILEGKRELWTAADYERIIHGLLSCGLVTDAKRIHDMMRNQGFPSSEPLQVALMAAQAIPRGSPPTAPHPKPKGG